MRKRTGTIYCLWSSGHRWGWRLEKLPVVLSESRAFKLHWRFFSLKLFSKLVFVKIWDQESEMKWLWEKGNPTGPWFFCSFSCPRKLNLILFNFLWVIYLMAYGALIEVHGGVREGASVFGDSYWLGRGIDFHGCEMFWQGISYDCCPRKVWFNLFYKVFVSEAEGSWVVNGDDNHYFFQVITIH